MADPISAGLVIGATAFKTVGAVKQASGQSKQYTDQAQGNLINQAVAEQDAKVALQQGQQEAAQIDRTNRLRVGAMKSIAGSSGIGASGSVLDIIADSVAQGELDKQTAIYDSKLRARAYRLTANEQGRQAAGAFSAAKDVKRSGYISAAGELLGGATDVYKLKKS